MNEKSESTQEEFIATTHAYERAKERMSWSKKVLDRMMPKAYNKGFTHSDTKGALQKHLDALWLEYKTCNKVRIYGENIYFFKDQKLITLYRLNNKLLKHVRHI